MEKRCFLCGLSQVVKTRIVWSISSVVRWWPASNGVSTEDEESPLLDATAREQLVKTKEAVKGFVGAVVICGLQRLAVAL
jgi:hypothetical protein